MLSSSYTWKAGLDIIIPMENINGTASMSAPQELSQEELEVIIGGSIWGSIVKGFKKTVKYVTRWVKNNNTGISVQVNVPIS